MTENKLTETEALALVDRVLDDNDLVQTEEFAEANDATNEAFLAELFVRNPDERLRWAAIFAQSFNEDAAREQLALWND